MTDLEVRLGEIHERVNNDQPIPLEDIQWLLEAGYRLQDMVRHWMQRVEQLRDHLREIQWSGSAPSTTPACPFCGRLEETGRHGPECKLWLAIRTA